MICNNCGTPIPDDSRFCPTCGTPVQQQAAPTPPPPPPQASYAPPPPPPPQPAAPAAPLVPKTLSVTLDGKKTLFVFRIVCLVLAVLFACFAVYHIYIMFSSAISGVRNLLYGYTTGLGYVIFYRLLLLSASVVACVFLAISAASWKPTFSTKLVLGTAIPVGIRFLAALINFVRSVFYTIVNQSGSLGAYMVTVMPLRFLYVLGYAATAALMFFAMYLFHCPPFDGKLSRKKKSA